MKSYITLPNVLKNDLPKRYQSDDVRYTEELVAYFVDQYTDPGDMVFDPFTGFGTTLEVAKTMGRKAFGLEIHQDRVMFLRENGLTEVIQGDTTRFPISQLPSIDFLMTSPPYMGIEDPADALTGYKYSGSYDTYLDTIAKTFDRMKPKLNPRAHLVIEISNLKGEYSLTTLAWDVGKVIAKHFTFLGEVIICWEGERKSDGIYGYGYDHSYCLVYRYDE